MTVRRIEEHPPTATGAGRLGRHVNHDPRSRAFAVVPRWATTLVSVRHERVAPIFDQGDLGSCTGNAALGAVGTRPLYDNEPAMTYDEALAVRIYSSATGLDPYQGTYPPDDTGSDGLSVAKACQQLGLVSGYSHAFGLAAAITALQTVPVITGVSWYSSMDRPDSSGRVSISADAYVRGGHEFEIVGVDVTAKEVLAVNSWGDGWGDHGLFRFSYDTWDRLLSEDGDVTVLAPLAAVPDPTDPDRALWDTVRAWAAARHIGGNRQAARAVTAWANSKGYPTP